jgi:hypothetical protein
MKFEYDVFSFFINMILKTIGDFLVKKKTIGDFNAISHKSYSAIYNALQFQHHMFEF